jgi:hypothetical protein
MTQAIGIPSRLMMSLDDAAHADPRGDPVSPKICGFSADLGMASVALTITATAPRRLVGWFAVAKDQVDSKQAVK